jgi:hypothetical protein
VLLAQLAKYKIRSVFVGRTQDKVVVVVVATEVELVAVAKAQPMVLAKDTVVLLLPQR